MVLQVVKLVVVLLADDRIVGPVNMVQNVLYNVTLQKYEKTEK